jgi:hypothetical protein
MSGTILGLLSATFDDRTVVSVALLAILYDTTSVSIDVETAKIKNYKSKNIVEQLFSLKFNKTTTIFEIQ